MRMEGLQTLSTSLRFRSATGALQAALAKAQIELSTGRHADQGLALGAGIARSIEWRGEIDEMEALSSRLALAGTRASLTQSALTAVVEQISKLTSSLTGARGAQNGPDLARTAAESALSSVTSLLNTTFDGQYVFSGTNTQSASLNGYTDSARLLVSDAALSALGVSPDDPAFSEVPAADLKSFLATEFHELFEPESWAENWSGAADDVQSVRLGSGRTTEPGVSTAETGFRKLVESVVSIASLAQDHIGHETFATLIDTALSGLASAQLAIGNAQARLGTAEGDIAAARTALTLRTNILSKMMGATESVDQFETATRVNTLMSQLEASYTITGKLQQLRLTNFI